MSIEEYAAERGIEIINQNPKQGEKNMARETLTEKNRRLQAELDEAHERIEEMEDERADALSAFGIEIVDDSNDPDTEIDDE